MGKERALQAWSSLLGCEAFHSAVITRTIPGGEITGFGASVFVTGEFAGAELADPQPGLNGRILRTLGSRRPVILNHHQIRQANTAGDLQLIILYGSWKRGLPREDICEVQMLLASSFQQEHAGYRVGRMLTELVTPEDVEYAQAIPAWRVVDRGRGLAIVTRESVFADPGSVAMGLFHHRRPVLGLQPAEQRLVQAALNGLGDQELADHLHLSLSAVKRRWANLFDIVGISRPDLAPPAGGATRGPQKRHRVLAYIRQHPEELRPFHFERPPAPRAARRASGTA